jgi:predicted NBD/HSP70 family sugar kinase
VSGLNVPLGPGGVDSSAMRVANLSAVLATVIRGTPLSRARLVEETGLRKATVSSLVDELIDRGWLSPAGERSEGVGRPEQLLKPNADQGFLIGAELNVDYLAILACDFACTERRLMHKAVDVRALGPKGAVERLASMLEATLSELATPPERVLGVGLAVPGVVDERGTLLVAANLDWHRIDIGGLFEAALGDLLPARVPIIVENEANLGAMAEHTFGARPDLDNFVYLSSELGVGAGVVVDGELFRGVNGAAGEVGHITVDPDGPLCDCGKRGCWQTFIAQGAFSGAPLSEAEVARLVRYLAIGLGNLVQMYNPRTVVLGGFLADAIGDARDALQAELAKWVLDDFGAGLEIALSTRGQQSSIWGSVALVLRWLAARPRSVDAASAISDRSSRRRPVDAAIWHASPR